MSKRWPLSLAIREGFAGAVASRALSTIVAVTAAYLLAGVGFANAVDVSSLARAEREWIDAGGYAFVVEPASTEDSSISVSACERLSAVDGIKGSFAVSISNQAAYPSNAPGTQATWARVSPGVFQFFGLNRPAGSDVLVTPSVTQATALGDGEHTIVTVVSYGGTGTAISFPVTVTVVDSPLLGEIIAGAYLTPDLFTGDAQQCYVLTDAAHVGTIRSYLAAALGSSPTSPAIVQPRLTDNTYGIDFATAYGDRLLGWAWLAAALVLSALWAVLQHGRRTRMAIYSTFGAHARARMMIQLTEWAAISGTGAIWGWAIGLTAALGRGADVHIAITQVTGQIAAAWCSATILVIFIGLVPVRTLLDALKDRT